MRKKPRPRRLRNPWEDADVSRQAGTSAEAGRDADVAGGSGQAASSGSGPEWCGDYVLGPLEEGVTGTGRRAFRAVHRHHGHTVLLEQLPGLPELHQNLDRAYEALQALIRRLRHTRHQNVRNVLDCFCAGGTIVVCHEWEGGAPLGEFASTYGPLEERLAGKFILQTLEGLKCLHRLGHHPRVDASSVVVVSGQAKVAAAVADLLPGDGARQASEASLRGLALALLNDGMSQDAKDFARLCEKGAGLQELSGCAFLDRASLRGRRGLKRQPAERVSGLGPLLKRPKWTVGSNCASEANTTGTSERAGGAAPCAGLAAGECRSGQAGDTSASSKHCTSPTLASRGPVRIVVEEEDRPATSEPREICEENHVSEDLSRDDLGGPDWPGPGSSRAMEGHRQEFLDGQIYSCGMWEEQEERREQVGQEEHRGQNEGGEEEREKQQGLPGQQKETGMGQTAVSCLAEALGEERDACLAAGAGTVPGVCTAGAEGSGTDRVTVSEGVCTAGTAQLACSSDCIELCSSSSSDDLEAGSASPCSAQQPCSSVAVVGSGVISKPGLPPRPGVVLKGMASCSQGDGEGCSTCPDHAKPGRPRRKAKQVGSDHLMAKQLDEKLNKRGTSSFCLNKHRQPGAEAQCIIELTSQRKEQMYKGAILAERNVLIEPNAPGGRLDFEYTILLVESHRPLNSSIKKGTCKRVLREGCSYQVWAGPLPEKGKGWGVIAMERIPSGHCVFEYAGDLQTEEEMQKRAGEVQHTKYIYDFDYPDRTDIQSLTTSRRGQLTCIDACAKGNVSRFVNHSCDPW
eukprot:evm.model.scf_543EXC.3 EVM.evm.TU.scf_543EXC.3   scf_543EXC:15089-20758(+)